MRNLFLLLVFLGALLGTTMAPSAAHASQWHRMTKPPVSAQEYSQRFARALAINADGRSAVDGPNCGLTCATPEDVLIMLQHRDPGANLTSVSQLPAFIAHLVVRDTPPGTWRMGCKGDDGSASAPGIWDCMARIFHTGEKCLADPNTKRCVFAFDCGNVVGIEIHEADCIQLHMGLHAGDEAHIFYLGNRRFPQGECPLMIQKAGEDERGSPALDECPRDACNAAEPARYLHLPVQEQPRISFVAHRTGDYVVTMSRKFLDFVTVQDGVLDICVITPDGRQSLGRAVNGRSFVDDKTYVLYRGMTLSSPWRGKPYEWPFADEGVKPHVK